MAAEAEGVGVARRWSNQEEGEEVAAAEEEEEVPLLGPAAEARAEAPLQQR